MKENGKAPHRHDISDMLWEKIKDLLSGGAGKRSRRTHDNRRFINAVSWIFRTDVTWRDVPLNTAAGKIHTDAFATGGIGMSGKA
jgi:transposase